MEKNASVGYLISSKNIDFFQDKVMVSGLSPQYKYNLQTTGAVKGKKCRFCVQKANLIIVSLHKSPSK